MVRNFMQSNLIGHVSLAIFLASTDVWAAPPQTNSSPMDWTGARKLYVAKCAKCHRFYDPKDYDDEAWNRWMQSMSGKAKLNQAQTDLLSGYLEAYRSGKVAGEPQKKPGKISSTHPPKKHSSTSAKAPLAASP